MEIATISPTIVNTVNNLLEKYYKLSNHKQTLDKKLFYYLTFNYSPKYSELFYNELFDKNIKNNQSEFKNSNETNYLLYGLGLMKSSYVKEVFELYEKKNSLEKNDNIKFDFAACFAMARMNEIEDYNSFKQYRKLEIKVSI